MATTTAPLKKLKADANRIFKAALEAVDPEASVRRHVARDGRQLRLGDRTLDLQAFDRILLLGAGKAGAPMAHAIEDILGERITEGCIVVKDGHGMQLKYTTVHEAGHPVPDHRGVAGSEAVLKLSAGAGPEDLVICLISGGGSALMIAPAEGISLRDKQEATRRLLACGATIHEINTVRKHLSRIKGGLLARSAYPATVFSLILSDVVGDDLDVIASGPAVPDTSTFGEAIKILRRYDIWEEMAPAVRNRIERGAAGGIEETPKSEDPVFSRCHQLLVGTNLQALEAAARAAADQGYRSLILTSKLEGEAREIGKALAAIAKEIVGSGQPLPPPACVLCGGETTVTLRGEGKGGRCQETALAASLSMAGLPGALILAAGTDGNDGPTDAAGAVADGGTVARALALGLDPRGFLERNDAYHFFERLEDLLITGPTRTNVMDVYMLLAG